MRFRGEFYFLSNMYPCTLEGKLHTYNSAEQAYVYAKCDNKADQDRILACQSGYSAKQVGKTVKLRSDWDSIKLKVMEKVLRMKFGRGSVLARLLVETGDMPLQEDNTWGDTFWGVCNGVGENHLGKLLMKLRDELR